LRIFYNAANNLKGSIKIAPIILNTTPRVKPTIAKGSSSSQTKKRRKNNPTARGQHKTNNIQNSKTAINNFIATKIFYLLESNIKPDFLINLCSVN
jgi:hypothetical protein